MAISLAKDPGNSLISANLLAEFKSKVGKSLETTIPPETHGESWRKFPLGGFNLSEFNSSFAVGESINIHSSLNSTDWTEENASKVSVLLEELLKQSAGNYFALLSLFHAKEYYYFEIDENRADILDWQFQSEESLSASSVFLVRVGKNTSSKIKEGYKTVSKTGNLHLLASVSFYWLEKSSYLKLQTREDYDSDLYHFRSVFSHQERDSKLELSTLPLGGFRGKTFYFPRLAGTGSEANISGLTALSKREFNDVEILVTHLADHTNSKLVYKTIVADKSHHIFTGNLHIPANLKKVTAHQESHNLSMNKKARAEAIPKLEVFAEDVSCTHGATVGDIDEEQLFYLLSRGLNPNEAKHLLVSAFYNEMISKIAFSEEDAAALSVLVQEKILAGGD
ncbi:SufD family Fe-S cluster assembly protein [Leptospira ilyithenensis]|uniref:SufD family Fe-S cluster assembly protein n=1 Tax=Leptospira ilyithenensis TaxID=2484901 RepID=UPI001FE975C8|nr:SufD family Fe-S cluster assembly protein [Leptospira ilyithenensis]